MIYTLALFTALFVATLTLMVGSGLLGSLLGLRMALEGFSEPVIGLVMSGFYVGLVGGSFLCPGIVQRAGHIRAFAAFAAVNTTATLLYPLFLSAPVWFGFRLLTGISMMGLYMVVESWLNDRTESHMRGRVFSVYMAMTFLGLGSGQFLLKFRPIESSDLFLVVGIFTSLSLLPVVLTRSLHPELPETSRPELRRLLHKAPLGLLGSFIAGMIAGAFYSLGPVFVARSGLSVSTAAYFMATTILCGLALQWPVGNLSDRSDRLRVLSVLALLVCLASLTIFLVGGRSLWLLIPATALYGGFAFTLYPVAVAHTNDRLEPSEIVPASTALILFYGLGACLGPPVASMAMKILGPAGLYAFIALCSGLLAAAVIRFRPAAKPPFEEPVPYVPVPRTSHVVTALDPRLAPPTPEEGSENEPKQTNENNLP